MHVSRLDFSSVHEIPERLQRRWRVLRRRLRRLRQWPHRMSYELSYAKPDDPPIRRWFMRAMEDLSGRRRLLRLYRPLAQRDRCRERVHVEPGAGADRHAP